MALENGDGKALVALQHDFTACGERCALVQAACSAKIENNSQEIKDLRQNMVTIDKWQTTHAEEHRLQEFRVSRSDKVFLTVLGGLITLLTPLLVALANAYLK